MLLGRVVKLLRPARNRILVSSISVARLDRSGLSGCCGRFNCIFRFTTLLSSLGICRGVNVALLRANTSGGAILPVIRRGLGLIGLSLSALCGCPSRLSKNVHGHIKLTHALIAGPGVVLCSRPAANLSPVAAHIVRRLVFSVRGGLGLASMIISRSMRVFGCTSGITLLRRNVVGFFKSTGAV